MVYYLYYELTGNEANDMTVRILAVGDVCGKPGLDFLRRSLRAVQKTYRIDFTVVNGPSPS